MSNLPTIAITMGDPCGIGPEVVVKALSNPSLTELCHPLVVGSTPILMKTAEHLGLSLNITSVLSPEEAANNNISILDPGNLNAEDIVLGQVSADAGRASVEWILEAGRMALNGDVQAIATAPINKEAARAAGYEDIGHMELLQKLSGAKEVATMLTAGNLRVVHLTTHRSLARAVEYVKKENILSKLELTHICFKNWGFDNPRIAIAALNPHGGDGGLLGREELDEILPAVKIGLDNGINVAGPIPADSVFPQALAGLYDVVFVLYHDQGHIPIKVKDFDGSISINLGFPFTRTSVDHGTAFDIAGKGVANPDGMIGAIEAAAIIAKTGKLPDI